MNSPLPKEKLLDLAIDIEGILIMWFLHFWGGFVYLLGHLLRDGELLDVTGTIRLKL